MKNIEDFKPGDIVYFLICESCFFLAKGLIKEIELKKSIIKNELSEKELHEGIFLSGEFYNEKGRIENFSIASLGENFPFSDSPEILFQHLLFLNFL